MNFRIPPRRGTTHVAGGRRGTTVKICACAMVVLFVFLAMNTPLTIMVWQAYDDGLFVRIAQSLAGGRWLGRFDELTLAKGPGYPAFLAASYWSGLPITLTQAIFHSIASAAIAMVAYKSSGSRAWALVLMALLLFHPKLLELGRIMRDGIYMSQSILLLAMYAYLVFFAKNAARTRLALATGLLLGWFWLTREEGVWMLPSLLVLLLFGFARNRSDRPGRMAVLKSSSLLAATFVATLAVFSTINLAVYGKFIGVDFKEHNFQAAISAMESVQHPDPVPFVAVPHSVRAELYDVSPTFATLKPYLDPEQHESPWVTGGCPMRPTACGDISNGFFMWAVREAAGKLGHYKTPASASAFFAGIENELETACNDGRLECKTDHVPMLPPLTSQQVDWIPRSLRELFNAIMSPGDYPGFSRDGVFGDDAAFAATLAFLNEPAHLPKQDVPDVRFEASGWYLNRSEGSSWFKLNASDKLNPSIPVVLTRLDSPDIAISQETPSATKQRFQLSVECVTECRLDFTSEDGTTTQVRVESGHDELATQYFHVGNALLAFNDLGHVQRLPSPALDRRIRLTERIRKASYKVFNYTLPPFMILGFFAFLVAGLVSIRKRSASIALAIACASWTALATRGAILVMVDISSFSAIHTPYMLPVYAMALTAATFSLISLRQVFRPLDRLKPANEPAQAAI